jgi:CheY-like chemotaxis protein
MENATVHQPVPSIIVVDDTPANLHLLTGMLKKRGYKVRPVSSGKFALQTAKHDPPDLILLDIIMPEMDGYEVCECLTADEQLSGIPVIFISALNETMDKVKAFKVGGVDYVTKPFQFGIMHFTKQSKRRPRISRGCWAWALPALIGFIVGVQNIAESRQLSFLCFEESNPVRERAAVALSEYVSVADLSIDVEDFRARYNVVNVLFGEGTSSAEGKLLFRLWLQNHSTTRRFLCLWWWVERLKLLSLGLKATYDMCFHVERGRLARVFDGCVSRWCDALPNLRKRHSPQRADPRALVISGHLQGLGEYVGLLFQPLILLPQNLGLAFENPGLNGHNEDGKQPDYCCVIMPPVWRRRRKTKHGWLLLVSSVGVLYVASCSFWHGVYLLQAWQGIGRRWLTYGLVSGAASWYFFYRSLCWLWDDGEDGTNHGRRESAEDIEADQASTQTPLAPPPYPAGGPPSCS